MQIYTCKKCFRSYHQFMYGIYGSDNMCPICYDKESSAADETMRLAEEIRKERDEKAVPFGKRI